MKKCRPLVAVYSTLCACTLLLFHLQGNAASYQPSGSTLNGNSVNDLIGPTAGLIEMNITFNTLNSTTLLFDQLTPDNIENFAFNVSNDSGSPWEGFAITVEGGLDIADDPFDSWMDQPVVNPTTGTVFGVLPVGASGATGLPTTWGIFFADPSDTSIQDPESIGMTIDGAINQLLFPSAFLISLIPVPVQDTIVPIPTAAWLFGSGLLGLLGISRRRSYTAKNENKILVGK